MKNPRPDGLSSQEEFDILCRIGDSIDSLMNVSDGKHLYVGRNTSSNTRDFYFYTSDVENLNICLNSIKQKFPNYEFEQGDRQDADWSTYVDFLYPTPIQHQHMMDRRVCEQLEANGDDLSIERDIDHRAYFKEKSKAKMFRSYLEQGEFHNLKTGKTKPLFGDIYIDFKHFGAPVDIYNITYDLFSKTQELKGIYDGWGCTVETQSKT